MVSIGMVYLIELVMSFIVFVEHSPTRGMNRWEFSLLAKPDRVNEFGANDEEKIFDSTRIDRPLVFFGEPSNEKPMISL